MYVAREQNSTCLSDKHRTSWMGNFHLSFCTGNREKAADEKVSYFSQRGSIFQTRPVHYSMNQHFHRYIPKIMPILGCLNKSGQLFNSKPRALLLQLDLCRILTDGWPACACPVTGPGPKYRYKQLIVASKFGESSQWGSAAKRCCALAWACDWWIIYLALNYGKLGKCYNPLCMDSGVSQNALSFFWPTTG